MDKTCRPDRAFSRTSRVEAAVGSLGRLDRASATDSARRTEKKKGKCDAVSSCANFSVPLLQQKWVGAKSEYDVQR